jgi:hypothetical protein
MVCDVGKQSALFIELLSQPTRPNYPGDPQRRTRQSAVAQTA